LTSVQSNIIDNPKEIDITQINTSLNNLWMVGVGSYLLLATQLEYSYQMC